MKKFQFLEHTGDIKIKTQGRTLNEIFENFTLAVSEYLSRGVKIKISKKEIKTIEGRDTEELLYNFLDEIIYLLDAEDFIISKADVSFDEENKIKAVFHGDNASKYNNLDSIKSATYSEMSIKKIKDKWEAQAVLDV